MTDTSPKTDTAHPQLMPAPPEPLFLGYSAFELRSLLPVAACVGFLSLALVVLVIFPMQRTAGREPNATIRAVLSDNLLLLHLRVWPLLAIAALGGGALALADSRRTARALARLEQRLRRVAIGEAEDLPPARGGGFTQFDDVVVSLRFAFERTTRRHRAALQQVQDNLKRVVLRLAEQEVPRVELRKTLGGIVKEVEAVLDSDRKPAGGKMRP